MEKSLKIRYNTKVFVNILLTFSLVIFFGVISSAEINDTLHINLQTTYDNGTIQSGTFTFAFNITENSSSSCSGPVVYNHSLTETTDTRGIVSIYLPTAGSGGGNLSELDFDKQYYLCYSRDGSLKDVSQLGRVPYSFRATQVNLSEITVDSNLNMTGFNVTASWFKGIYDWIVGVSSQNYFTFNGTQLDFNESQLNTTIDSKISSGSVNNSDFLDGYDSGFFMPLNKSVYGDFDFNGGWIGGGVSISGGDIYTQTLYVYNITSLTVSNLNINGSLFPQEGFSKVFDIGSADRTWRDLYLGGEISSNGTGDNYFLGNVGIGTISPQNTLNIIGDINATGLIYGNGSQLTSISETDPHWTANWTADQYLLNTGDTAPTGDYDFNSGTLFIDSVNHRVGIGTVTPLTPLHVEGTGSPQIRIRSTTSEGNASLNFMEGGNVGVLLYYKGLGNELIFYDTTTGGTALMTIERAGNVGIGTDNPSEILHLERNGLGVHSTIQNDLYTSSTGEGNIPALILRKSQNITKGAITKLDVGTAMGKIEFKAPNNAETVFNPAARIIVYEDAGSSAYPPGRMHLETYSTSGLNTNQLVLDSNGNVGIGTTSPDDKFQVIGNVLAGKTTTTRGILKAYALDGGSDGSAEGTLFLEGRGGYQDWTIQPYQNSLRMFNSATPITSAPFTISTGGNVGIGTTSPQQTLHVNGSILANETINSTVDVCITGGNCLSDSGSGGEPLWSGNYSELSSGQVLFGQMEQDGNLTWDDTNKRLGIGTTSPSYPLTVKLNSASGNVFGIVNSAGNLRMVEQITVGDDAFRVMYDSDNAIKIRLSTAGDSYLNGGNVGIGETSPGAKLHIYDSSAYKGIVLGGAGYSGGTLSSEGVAFVLGYSEPGNRQLWITESDSVGISTHSAFRYISGDRMAGIDAVTPITSEAIRLPVEIGTDTSNVAIGDHGEPQYNEDLPAKLSVYGGDGDAGLVIVQNPSANQNYFEIREYSGDMLGGTTKMVIDSSGNVGINTTSPGELLEVAGNINSTGGDICITGGNCLSNVSGGSGGLWDSSGSDIYYNDGNVGIGTASPESNLEIAANATDRPAIILSDDNGGDTDYWIGIDNDNAGDDDDKLQIGKGIVPGTTPYVTLDKDGNVGIGDTTPDGRLDIHPPDSTNYVRFFPSESERYGMYTHTSSASESVAGIRTEGSASSASSAHSYGIKAFSENYGSGNAYGGWFKAEITGTGSHYGIYAEADDYAGVFIGGNVGIGTETPQNTLNVVGTFNATGDWYSAGTTIVTGNRVEADSLTQNDVDSSEIAADAVSDSELDGGFGWTLDTDLNIDSNTLVVSYDDDKVGIGTSSPLNKLDINTTTAEEGISFDGMVAISGYSGNDLMRLNDEGHFSGGVYTPGIFWIGDYLRADGGIHVGGSAGDPGTGNLVVEGNIDVVGDIHSGSGDGQGRCPKVFTYDAPANPSDQSFDAYAQSGDIAMNFYSSPSFVYMYDGDADTWLVLN